ncbi:putative peptidase C78, ubiquitin modifier-specific peptidase 1/ 2 [Medicago truncatula]|nr:zinc finger-containing ubiquitin peptidase 1 isoform X1 [Medicago truncatula]AES72695.2 zinc finger with UFM1-specific peptidase domain protein [Medicago truncatula]RHN69769.1 putative peptidase C78, ubiquitin modifier-specific peptidase 1/ 2 [Medicago truncatula]
MDPDSCSTCPFCDLPVPSSQLQWHANAHFHDPALPQQSEQSVSGSELEAVSGDCNNWHGGETSRDNGECKMDEKISCLIGLQTRSNFYKVEAGLIALLRNCLESETENSKSILSCCIDHFQSLNSEDAGWGCGWRNIQMLSSHLLAQRPEAREVLFGGSGFVPDILSLQRWLEIAWEKGFDAPGAAQLDHAVYGSKKWIGTTECSALLRSFALRARIVDFGPKESQSVVGISVDNTVDKTRNDKMANSKVKSEAYQVLMDFVWNYFSDENSIQFGQQHVVICEKTPLYFQHDGHSRTIVGVQAKHQQNGILPYNLLVLDPAHSTATLERSLKQKIGWQKLIKKDRNTLKKPQYQLCYVDPGIASEEEMEDLKTIDSIFLEL